MRVKLNPDDFPLASLLVRVRNDAANRIQTRPESLGCYFVLDDTCAAEFLQERLRVLHAPQNPLVGDLRSPLAVIDNMPVVHRHHSPGVAVVLPSDVQEQTQADRMILRGIYNGVAKGTA